MRKREKKENISGLLVLLLFAVFAVCVLSVLLTGAGVVQRLTERDQDGYDRRTVAQFITTKVRQADAADMVFVGDFSQEAAKAQGDTLFLTSVLDGETCYTRIYCQDGYVRELFSERDSGFLPEDGEKIMKLHGLHFSIEESMLYIDIQYEDGQTEQMVLHLRGGGMTA